MELAKGKLTITYDDKLEGLPCDLDKLSENTEQAMVEVQKALTSYTRACIKDMPNDQAMDIKIHIHCYAQTIVTVRFVIDHEFLLYNEQGKPYVAQIEQEGEQLCQKIN